MIDIAEEVSAALAEGAALVALESSIIAHGLPAPANVETALALEAAIREGGAVPATIGVIDGRLVVGLSRDQIVHLADERLDHAKAGVRDLAILASTRRSAGTTVSATSMLAARVGIRCFATGGIGGVHRGDGSDVSSDLAALATHPIAVVSSGPKSILDLPRTAEMLESLGVPVIGYQCDTLPAFYTRGSSVPLEHRVETPGAAARIISARLDGLRQAGMLIANPVPVADEISHDELEPVIEAALAAAAAAGITGKATTPALLAALRRDLGDRAVACNQALVLCNARLAAAIAVALAALDPV